MVFAEWKLPPDVDNTVQNMNSTDSIYPPGTFGPDGIVIRSPYYEYLVTKGVAYTFVVLFATTTFIHAAQAIHFRMWWLLPTAVLAGIGETIGWSGRLWSSYAPLVQNPYLIQIVATIIAPTPFVGAIFVIFSSVTQKLGIQYSRLSPRWYSRIFLTADIIALVVQGAGGGIAGTANTDADTSLGANVMLGGIVFQLVSLMIFTGVAIEYHYRYIHDLPIREPDRFGRREWGRRMKIFTGALVFTLSCLLIRSVYRTAELADGWNGVIIDTEVYFDVFDAAMVVLAMLSMNLVHPGYWLKTAAEENDTQEPILLARKHGNASSTLDVLTYRV
ncbi:hypothetical protein EUX98_g8261 [Antrodiella citrinella]|uniref:RTA1-domain-containing protein n=1 Tax=Antrodiella citrinella TaxID=2447956 RepID=A0A4S4MAM9_9APHY|nr:hypothetical protein EUX98_g8261 [Antrodiella citrinella]